MYINVYVYLSHRFNGEASAGRVWWVWCLFYNFEIRIRPRCACVWNMGFTVLLNVSSASRINLAISCLQVGMSSISATLCPQFQTPKSGSALATPPLRRSNLMYAPTSPNFNAFPLSCSIAFTASASLLRMIRDEALRVCQARLYPSVLPSTFWI